MSINIIELGIYGLVALPILFLLFAFFLVLFQPKKQKRYGWERHFEYEPALVPVQAPAKLRAEEKNLLLSILIVILFIAGAVIVFMNLPQWGVEDAVISPGFNIFPNLTGIFNLLEINETEETQENETEIAEENLSDVVDIDDLIAEQNRSQMINATVDFGKKVVDFLNVLWRPVVLLLGAILLISAVFYLYEKKVKDNKSGYMYALMALVIVLALAALIIWWQQIIDFFILFRYYILAGLAVLVALIFLYSFFRLRRQ